MTSTNLVQRGLGAIRGQVTSAGGGLPPIVKTLLVGGLLGTWWDAQMRPLLVKADAVADARRHKDTRRIALIEKPFEALPWADKELYGVVLVKSLERTEDARRALEEAQRVAENVYVVVPAWWRITNWLDPRVHWIQVDHTLFPHPRHRGKWKPVGTGDVGHGDARQTGQALLNTTLKGLLT